MAMTRGRRLLTCYHEAGHALVRWYFGHDTDKVVVHTVDEVRSGKRITSDRGFDMLCEGAVIGWAINQWPYKPNVPQNADLNSKLSYMRNIMVSRDIELINCISGSVSEAVYRRISLVVAIMMGGEDDWKHAERIRKAWFNNETENSNAATLAERRAVAIVRSPRGSAAIKAMAELLMTRGEIYQRDISRICRKEYGGMECQFGAWDRYWPPSLKQLQEGFIPEFEQSDELASHHIGIQSEYWLKESLPWLESNACSFEEPPPWLEA